MFLIGVIAIFTVAVPVKDNMERIISLTEIERENYYRHLCYTCNDIKDVTTTTEKSVKIIPVKND